MVPQPSALRHSLWCVFPHLSSTYIPFSSYPLRAVKFSQMMLEKVFEMVWWRGRNWAHTKRILMLQCFSPLKILTSPFYLKRLLELLFSFLFLSFFNTFSLTFFYPSSLWGLGDFDDIWGERQPSKILFRWHGMIWLIHDYEDGGVVDISVVDTYFKVE
jgi:hypothetical protein